MGIVDGDTVTRVVIGLNGLMIAWFGNRMPKTLAPSACARQAITDRDHACCVAVSTAVIEGRAVRTPASVQEAG